MISKERQASLDQTYQSLKPMFQHMQRMLRGVSVLLDVGSGEGYLSLKMAEDLKAARAILVDKLEPLVDLPPNVTFRMFDIHDSNFVRSFQNKVQLITCFFAFHEFEDPIIAATNIISILPIGGNAVFVDYSQEGWKKHAQLIGNGDLAAQLHLHDDIQRTMMFGLDTNVGIRHFWESLFPRFPGECGIVFGGDTYKVFYIPKQWGEVKEPPEDIRLLLEELARKK